jgi:hypothetical protein
MDEIWDVQVSNWPSGEETRVSLLFGGGRKMRIRAGHARMATPPYDAGDIERTARIGGHDPAAETG